MKTMQVNTVTKAALSRMAKSTLMTNRFNLEHLEWEIRHLPYRED